MGDFGPIKSITKESLPAENGIGQDLRPAPLQSRPSLDSMGSSPSFTDPVEQFQQSLKRVLAIDDAVALVNDGDEAFALFRKSVYRNRRSACTIDNEADHAVHVFNFLLDFAAQRKFHVNQVCEVIRLLHQCGRWRAAWNSASELTERTKRELPEFDLSLQS